MIKKFLKERAATLGLALSLVVTQLTPLVPLTPKVAKAATAKYHCNTCGQDLTSNGSHTRQTTCGGTSFYDDAIYCGGSVTVKDSESFKNDHGGTYTWSTKYYLHCYKCGDDWTSIDSYPDTCYTTIGHTYLCCTCYTEYNTKPVSCTNMLSRTCSGTIDNGAITPLTGTITFNASTNGGTTSAEKGTCTFDLDYMLPANTATKPGWEFVGWNENSNAKSGQNSVYMSDNKTVYALFKKDLTVTFIDAGS